jgi:hypothetical protein
MLTVLVRSSMMYLLLNKLKALLVSANRAFIENQRDCSH